MKTGEYIFNNIEHIKINKLLMNKLYASALYRMKDKFVLEVLAPSSLKTGYNKEDEEYEEINNTIVDRWSQDIKYLMRESWPLTEANYYIEVDGMKIGKNQGSTTCYRYEPENNIPVNTVSEDRLNLNDVYKENANGIIKCTETNVEETFIPMRDDINTTLFYEDFMDALESGISSLFDIDSEYTDDEDSCSKYYEKQEKEEQQFFNKFRNSVTVPDYLKDESIVIADLFFWGKNLPKIDSKIKDVRFILESYRKYYLTRIKLSLPFGEYKQPINIISEEWGRSTNKIIIEGVVEQRKENNDYMPNGKKGIYIIYETIDNVLIQPFFYTTEFLMSDDLSNYTFKKAELLKDKGTNGFNKYKVFAGYVDADSVTADFELFKLVVTYECNKEFKLS